VQTAKKKIAKRLSRYIFDMWGRGSWFAGCARGNLLFAIVAKRCFQLLTIDEMQGELDVGGPDWHQRKAVNDFKQEVDRVIEKCFADGGNTWQPELPLGEPRHHHTFGT
jgi:hypothetical protein